MATTLYLTSTASTGSTSSFTGGATYLDLSLTRGGGVTSQTDNTVASLGAYAPANGSAYAPVGTTTTFNWANTGAVADPGGCLVWITEPLNTIAVTAPTLNMRASESNAMANYIVWFAVYLVDASNGTATRLSWMSNAGDTELGTTETLRSFAGNGSGGTIAQGGRILVFAAYAGAGTSASGYTASLFYNGTSAAASGDTWISFAETITEETAVANPPYKSIYPPLLAQ